MRYFGGFGGGRGWKLLNFLPDPSLLSLLIDGPGLRFFRDSAMPREKPLVTRDEIISHYQSVLNRWASHDSLLWKDRADNRFSVVCPPNEVIVTPCREPELVRVAARRPCIHFGEAMIYVDEQGRTASNYGDATLTGYRLEFPKVYSSADTGEEIVSAEGLPESHLFDHLSVRIRANTVPLVLDHPVRRIRTSFRFSISLVDLLEHIISTHAVGIRLVRPVHRR